MGRRRWIVISLTTALVVHLSWVVVPGGWTAEEAPLPDLVVSLIIAPSSAAAGESLSIIYTIQNTGHRHAEGFDAACSLTGPSGTTVLGNASIKGLAPGATYTGSMNVAVPANFAAGTYTLTITADYTGTVNESNETNNAATRFLLITNPSLERGQALLFWNDSPEPDVVGYRVYMGTASGVYTRVTSVGDVTTYMVIDLPAGATYFFAVTAYDNEGRESGFSNEMSKTISF